jgi:hypothetical protein
MGLTSISKGLKTLGGIVSKNSPSILTGLSVAGLVTTVILAVRATPKALLLMEVEREQRKKEKETVCRDSGEESIPLSKRDIVQIAWKCYIPAAAVGLTTVACIIGANTISLRRTAALASVYSITEAAFREYKAKVVETIGRNKEIKVRDEIASDTVKAHPSSSTEVIVTGKGQVLCYDTLSGRYFKSDIENIRQIINRLNHAMLTEMFMSINEWYYELGLAPTKLGDDMGWDIAKGLIEVKFSSQISEDGTPCLVLDYAVVPKFR